MNYRVSSPQWNQYVLVLEINLCKNIWDTSRIENIFIGYARLCKYIYIILIATTFTTLKNICKVENLKMDKQTRDEIKRNIFIRNLIRKYYTIV